jgi:hypothetical protein
MAPTESLRYAFLCRDLEGFARRSSGSKISPWQVQKLGAKEKQLVSKYP